MNRMLGFDVACACAAIGLASAGPVAPSNLVATAPVAVVWRNARLLNMMSS
jgi:hypothetical protein